MLSLDPDGWNDAPQGIIDLIRTRLAAPDGLVIDASVEATIPAQVAQLLVSARASAAAAGVPFRLARPSDAARESLQMLGLGDLLETRA